MVVKRKRPKPLLAVIIIIGIILIIMAFIWIFLSSPVDRNNDTNVQIEIKSGTSTQEIASILKENNLIRSELIFNAHVKLSDVKSLKAATYAFSPSMNLNEIVKILEDGSAYIPGLVVLTFKEGQTVTDYAKLIAEKTNNTYEEVITTINNKDYINELISKHWFLTNAVLNPSIYYPLEGYLAPDTYHFENKDVDVKTIIDKVLKQTDKNMSVYKTEMQNNVHHYVTMASIVELEGTNTENRKMIVGVFNNRLNRGMNLGSDVTTYYALQHPMTSDLTSAQFAVDNPYNTRSTTMMGKMPVGPICNPSNSSLEASIHPIASDNIFFVADKHGNIFYTKTMAEHDRKIREIKEKGDWIW